MVVLGVIAFYLESDSLAGFVGEDEIFVDEVLILSIAEVVKFDDIGRQVELVELGRCL